MNPILTGYATIVAAWVPVLAVIGIVSYATANIPPGRHITEPEPTLCSEYLAAPSSDRIKQWIYTIEQGLIGNPELSQGVWDCVLDLYKMSETDQFMVRVCKADPNTDFNDLAFRALSAHLDKCEIRIVK